MKLYKLAPKKNTAQAMVEFAIVLPILLLLLYGLLEAGRLLFMYSTIVTASRQAARYGSATGEGINAGVMRYQDCAGIRVAANRVDFLNAFDEYDVIIQHDTGPGTTATYYCTNVPGNEPDPSLSLDPSDTYTPQGNSERIIVTIEGDFNPIVPRIVPFIARTEAGGNPIRAISARTIITGVSIEVTPPPGSGGGPSTGGLSLSITANPNSYTGKDELIEYTFTITNSGTTGDLTGPFTITGVPFAVDCSAATSPLIPGASTNCTIAPVPYLTTQTDVDTGFFEFTATASGTGPDGNPATDDFTSTITYSAPVENPSLSLSKTASADLATAGDQITYTFTVTNTGNVDLTAASVNDPKLGGTIAGCSGDLVVGASLTCTSPAYTVTAADVQAGQIDNTATASATYGTTPPDPATASETVDIYEGTLFLTVNPSPTSLSAPGTVTYNYRIKNNTASTLYLSQDPDFSPLSGHPGTHNCAAGTQLNAGDPSGYTCTGTYTVTDFNSAVACTVNGITGYCLQHTITANACTETGTNGCNGNRDRTSNSVTVRIPVTLNASLAFESITAAPSSPAQLTPPANTFPLDHPIVYTYKVKNQGNVTLTLSSPPIVDAMVTGSFSCDRTSLTPPGSDINNPVATSIATCTGTHLVTQPDLDAGLIASRQVTASAAFGTQVVSAVGQAPAVITFQGPRLSLQISANPTTFPEAGQVILYTYTLTNTGTVPLNGLYSITTVSGPTVVVDCSTADSPLNSGASTTCSGQATVSGPAGSSVVHTANARASDGTQQITSNNASATVTNPVLACSSIQGGAISFSTNTMRMTITNNNSYAVTISSIEVTWNHDKGRSGGADGRALNLSNARWGSASPFWPATSGTVTGPTFTISTFSPASAQTIAANSAPVIVFTFDNNYSNIEKTETIKIYLSTPGCENHVIQSLPVP